VADASQKFTCPVVNTAAPVFTAAVSVTTVPGATVVTTPPFEVMVRVVVVVAAYAGDATKSTTPNRLPSPFPSIFLTQAAGETVAKSRITFLSPLQLNAWRRFSTGALGYLRMAFGREHSRDAEIPTEIIVEKVWQFKVNQGTSIR
jgi:hypothetical protein